MLDSDLAELYGVETRRLKEQVRRNIIRFPGHFMFELTKEERRRKIKVGKWKKRVKSISPNGKKKEVMCCFKRGW